MWVHFWNRQKSICQFGYTSVQRLLVVSKCSYHSLLYVIEPLILLGWITKWSKFRILWTPLHGILAVTVSVHQWHINGNCVCKFQPVLLMGNRAFLSFFFLFWQNANEWQCKTKSDHVGRWNKLRSQGYTQQTNKRAWVLTPWRAIPSVLGSPTSRLCCERKVNFHLI